MPPSLQVKISQYAGTIFGDLHVEKVSYKNNTQHRNTKKISTRTTFGQGIATETVPEWHLAVNNTCSGM
jgi:hypothetical protein